MVRADSIAKGLASFVDAEVLPKMGGLQRWVFGTAAGVMAKRTDAVVQALMSSPIPKMFGLVDAEGLIDLELVYSELAKQAGKTPAVIPIPLLGELRLSAQDVDSLYRHILSADGQ